MYEYYILVFAFNLLSSAHHHAHAIGRREAYQSPACISAIRYERLELLQAHAPVLVNIHRRKQRPQLPTADLTRCQPRLLPHEALKLIEIKLAVTVDIEQIEELIEVARSKPSVCLQVTSEIS